MLALVVVVVVYLHVWRMIEHHDERNFPSRLHYTREYVSRTAAVWLRKGGVGNRGAHLERQAHPQLSLRLTSI